MISVTRPSSPDRLAVSVLVPTIGRIDQLAECLRSLSACAPQADEILVVVQGETQPTVDLVTQFADIGAHAVSCPGTGLGRSVNFGLRVARHEKILRTDDDCTVAPDWIGRCYAHLLARPDAIITGRVLPVGDPAAVPSTIDNPHPRDFTGTIRIDVLYHGNMAVHREQLIAAGGFDERIVPSAEDNDLCYRWLRSGRPLCYRPDMVVWHADSRSPDQLRQRYKDYGLGQGAFYAKHLRAGDLAIAGFVARALVAGLRLMIRTVMHGRRPLSDPRLGSVLQLPIGILRAWPDFADPHGTLLARAHARLRGLPIRTRMRRATTLRRSGRASVTPASRVFGWDRGEPIDRHYIARFLSANASDITGNVLEVGDNRYTRRYGSAVRRSDVIDVNAANRRATIVADLATSQHLPAETFDCVVCIQTLHLLYDVERAITQLHRTLVTGGVALVTMPGISQRCNNLGGAHDYWRFTAASAQRLFGEAFGMDAVAVDVHGNLASARAFLDGRATEELAVADLDVRDNDYPVLIGVRAVKVARPHALDDRRARL